MKIVYLVPVWFQLLVLECYNENCLLSTCLVSVVGAGVLYTENCLPVRFQLLVLECYTENRLPVRFQLLVL